MELKKECRELELRLLLVAYLTVDVYWLMEVFISGVLLVKYRMEKKTWIKELLRNLLKFHSRETAVMIMVVQEIYLTEEDQTHKMNWLLYLLKILS